MSVPTALLYSNGFNSAVEVDGDLPSDKARFYRDSAKRAGWQFVPHNADYYNADQMDKALAELVEKARSVGDRPVLMGCSMGGLLSLLALEELNRPEARAVLINPVLVPDETLLEDSLGQEVTNYVTGTTHLVEVSARKRLDEWLGRVPEIVARWGKEIEVHVDLDDEVLVAQATAEFCNPWCDVHEYPGGSHRFEHWDESWEHIVRI
ncbi:YqiA/YcfP family alpha/beta fold hydrolase [Saccharospirillum salsuginis]|uniref:Alpha/beta hydrolase family protein n=1 Tax=Saccharospirillum salsuginis TaxID=418750 RepID=A0A918NHF7_9GAMM|nr:YqiA/YcfP family alpha/beta fold hydrolase [Saccharospirillum salsuginis]GGX67936.1 hypothetical protein GCM10007392_39560 [Saccharospirillum salsuginis]